MRFQVDEAGREFLQQHWCKLCEAYDCASTEIDAAFASLSQKYSEPHRAYHNHSHIQALLRQAESFRHKIQDHDSVAFAIWFHDAIYNTKKGDNEEKSAELAQEMLGKLCVPSETISVVKQMILATKTHHLLDDSADLKLFLDFDLSILGVEENVYQEYSRAIRKEYSWVPYFLYRKGRKKVLENFLKRDRLYFTDSMKALSETQARRNIENELSQLR